LQFSSWSANSLDWTIATCQLIYTIGNLMLKLTELMMRSAIIPFMHLCSLTCFFHILL
jgi:hypothetical protein